MVPVFIITFLGWKFYHKTSFVRLADIDLDSDRRSAEDERVRQGILAQEEEESQDVGKTGWQRVKAGAITFFT